MRQEEDQIPRDTLSSFSLKHHTHNVLKLSADIIMLIQSWFCAKITGTMSSYFGLGHQLNRPHIWPMSDLVMLPTLLQTTVAPIVVDTRGWGCNFVSLVFLTAEKVTSLGKDWHRPCLRCEKCNKTLSAGAHAEVTHLKNKISHNLMQCNSQLCIKSKHPLTLLIWQD